MLDPKHDFLTLKNQKMLSKVKEKRSHYNPEKCKTPEFQEIYEHL